MRVREAQRGEWEIYRRLRLQSLDESPDAFRTLHAERVGVPDEEWEQGYEQGVAADHFVTFFAEAPEPVGITMAMIEDGVLQIFGMWIDPEARDQGLGRGLLDAVFTWGKIRGARAARLAVTIGNDVGEHLYARAGFEPTGETEPLRDGSELSCAWLERPL